ncbi:hypothetical protein SAMN04487772_101227 [[Clostridium] polysaccharolyticum]|uniref:Uncharacterized protein n=2 Tax=[Clostridium] polysaccharolyticum TaxID=29364 RepID=A0A1H9Y925_9FIRM|nr:hypothetical protein SAMN04487772_101227 [[Clostridium] polysaccharolyticum]
MRKWICEIEELQRKTYDGTNHITVKSVEFYERWIVLIMAIYIIVYLGKYAIGIGICIDWAVYMVTKQTESWCTSLIRCIIMLLSLFLGYSLCVIGFVLNRKHMNIFVLVVVIIYLTKKFLADWYKISIISQSTVAKMANELISVFVTIMFTAGTYVESLVFNDVPSLSMIKKSYHSIEQLKIVLASSTVLQKKIFLAYGKLSMEVIFLMLLPTLCISLFITGIIDLKEYWMKKYGQEDFWTRVEMKRKQRSLAKSKDIKTAE